MRMRWVWCNSSWKAQLDLADMYERKNGWGVFKCTSRQKYFTAQDSFKILCSYLFKNQSISILFKLKFNKAILLLDSRLSIYWSKQTKKRVTTHWVPWWARSYRCRCHVRPHITQCILCRSTIRPSLSLQTLSLWHQCILQMPLMPL